MLKEHLKDFNLLSIGLVLVASLIGLAHYRRLPPSLRYLTLLACFDVVMELITKLVSDLLGASNIFLFPFVSIGELTLLALAYRQALQLASFSKALPWLLSLFSAYALFVSFSQLGMVRYAVGLSIVVNLSMLGLAGLYFRKLLDELQVELLRYDSFFWLSIALMVYGLGNMLISLSSNYLLAHCSLRLQLIILGGVRILLNTALYLSYCVALWLRPQQAHAQSASSSIQRRAW